MLADPQTFRPDNALDAVTPMPVAALRILARHGFRLPPTLANNGGANHPAPAWSPGYAGTPATSTRLSVHCSSCSSPARRPPVGATLARTEAAVVVAEATALLDRGPVTRRPWCPDNLSFRMPDALVVTGSGASGRTGRAKCPRSP